MQPILYPVNRYYIRDSYRPTEYLELPTVAGVQLLRDTRRQLLAAGGPAELSFSPVCLAAWSSAAVEFLPPSTALRSCDS